MLLTSVSPEKKRERLSPRKRKKKIEGIPTEELQKNAKIKGQQSVVRRENISLLECGIAQCELPAQIACLAVNVLSPQSKNAQRSRR